MSSFNGINKMKKISLGVWLSLFLLSFHPTISFRDEHRYRWNRLKTGAGTGTVPSKTSPGRYRGYVFWIFGTGSRTASCSSIVPRIASHERLFLSPLFFVSLHYSLPFIRFVNSFENNFAFF